MTPNCSPYLRQIYRTIELVQQKIHNKIHNKAAVA